MWTTIDEEGNEHLTKVHQVDCKDQQFSENKKQFICNRYKKLCNENCPFYCGLSSYTKEYEDLPIIGVEIGNLNIRCYDSKSRETKQNQGDGLDLTDDFLLEYLEKNIWN